MARSAVAVKHEDADPGAGDGPKASKRRCVQSACVPCRKRKSKCDGGTPFCATCTAVYKTPCHYYDTKPSTSTTTTPGIPTPTPTPTSAHATGIKRESSVVSSAPASDHAEFLLTALRTLPDPEVCELIQHIRKDARLDTAAIADSWRKAVAVASTTPIEPQSLERDLSMLLGKRSLTQPEESNFETRSRTPEEPTPGIWTTVTNDVAFVERLLDLYFRWSHTFYVVFSRECFLKDFRSGRKKYCSPLLVNAVLAYACHYSDEPAARTDPENPRTAGDHFFEEARRLLYEDETPSLTTTQALCVMAMREPSAGRDSPGFMYMGRCMRMAIELGLHLSSSNVPNMELTPSEVEVRKVTFWGCFTVDTVWSICVGRIASIPRAAITLDKPILHEAPTGTSPSAHSGAPQTNSNTVTSRMFLQEFSSLSELINDNNFMFFAPKARFTSRLLLECYSRYQNWYKNLPQQLKLEGVQEPLPHIIVLHMLYHTAVVQLFRPMLKVDLIHSNVRPRDTCIDAANKVADLLRLYRERFSMRTCQLVLTHVILSVCILHLLYSPESRVSYRNLVEGMQALEDLSICHYFGARGFKVIHALSQVWKIPFPAELKGSILLSGSASPADDNILLQRPTTSIASRMGGGVGYSNLADDANPDRRESLSMFAKPNRKTIPLPSHTLASQGGTATPPGPRHSQPNMQPTYHSTTTTAQSTTAPAPNPPPPPVPSAETLFWTPMPGIGVPILPRSYQMSPMDLDNMLGGVNEWDRFSRDGFKMSDTWQQDAPVPYHTSHPEEYPHTSGPHNGYHAGPETAHYAGGGIHQQPVHAHAQTFDPSWWSGDGHHGNLA